MKKLKTVVLLPSADRGGGAPMAVGFQPRPAAWDSRCPRLEVAAFRRPAFVAPQLLSHRHYHCLSIPCLRPPFSRRELYYLNAKTDLGEFDRLKKKW